MSNVKSQLYQKEQPKVYRQDTTNRAGICSVAATCALLGGIMGPACLALSWAAVVVACIGIVAATLGIAAICKMPSRRGKVGVLLSIVVLLACSCFAIGIENE